ncbi:MAG: winged helix-turn-helix transcriptional regulator, partial [Phycisphaeraceae bacterium]|nr:winged helix-turn-helix transcriptional regulator [Phycisphaeraceae bacterium]
MNGVKEQTSEGTSQGLLEELKFERPRVMHTQIADHLRQLIISGQLPPHSEMPSTRQLARMWNTHIPTVHKALMPLVKEGLLVRINGKGTFVGQRDLRLRSVGVYAPTEFLEQPQYTPRRAIMSVLHEQLAAKRLETRLYLDPRPEDLWTDPLESLQTDVANHKIQALISLRATHANMLWQQKMPVAYACLSSLKSPTCVMLDTREFVRLSVERLA